MRLVVATWEHGPRTQRAALDRLKAFFAFCVAPEWISRNPATGIKTPDVPEPEPQPLSRDEIMALLTACDQFGQERWQRARMKALLVLMRFSELSIGDAVRLPKSAVEGETIVTKRKKTGKSVRIPIPRIVLEALESFPHVSAEFFFWSGLGDPDGAARTYGRRVQRVFGLAGVKDSSKRFRETVASEYAGTGIDNAQQALGHDSVRTTERHYAAWTPERQQGLAAAAARAFGDEAETLAGVFDSSLTHGEKPRAN